MARTHARKNCCAVLHDAPKQRGGVAVRVRGATARGLLCSLPRSTAARSDSSPESPNRTRHPRRRLAFSPAPRFTEPPGAPHQGHVPRAQPQVPRVPAVVPDVALRQRPGATRQFQRDGAAVETGEDKRLRCRLAGSFIAPSSSASFLLRCLVRATFFLLLSLSLSSTTTFNPQVPVRLDSGKNSNGHVTLDQVRWDRPPMDAGR